MMSLFNSIIVILKYSFVLLSSTFFFIGLALGNELVLGIFGMSIITYILYRKFNQLNTQYKIFREMPQELRDMIIRGEYGLPKEKYQVDDKRGYQ